MHGTCKLVLDYLLRFLPEDFLDLFSKSDRYVGALLNLHLKISNKIFNVILLLIDN